jgi:hypothetical protein
MEVQCIAARFEAWDMVAGIATFVRSQFPRGLHHNSYVANRLARPRSSRNRNRFRIEQQWKKLAGDRRIGGNRWNALE